MLTVSQWYQCTCKHCDKVMVWEEADQVVRTPYSDLMNAECPSCHKSTPASCAKPISDLTARVLLARGDAR